MKLVLLVTFLLLSMNLYANQSEKDLAIEKYFEISPTEEIWIEMINEVSKKLPKSERSKFININKYFVPINKLESKAKRIMATHFTLTEIKAFTEFIRKPEAKSAMNKIKFYIADLMPAIQHEIQKSLIKYESISKSKEINIVNNYILKCKKTEKQLNNLKQLTKSLDDNTKMISLITDIEKSLFLLYTAKHNIAKKLENFAISTTRFGPEFKKRYLYDKANRNQLTKIGRVYLTIKNQMETIAENTVDYLEASHKLTNG